MNKNIKSKAKKESFRNQCYIMHYLNEESKNKNADFIWMANIASQLIGAASVPEDSEAGFRPSRKECDER